MLHIWRKDLKGSQKDQNSRASEIISEPEIIQNQSFCFLKNLSKMEILCLSTEAKAPSNKEEVSFTSKMIV